MPLQRYALATLAAAVLILYGGLFPFSGWSFADPLALFRGATAYRIMRDDIFVNIVVFVPLGFCAWRTARHRHGLWASLALAAAALGLCLSLAVELCQAYLPSRKSSLVDVISNLAGSAFGGLIAMGTAPDQRDAAAWTTRSSRDFFDSRTGLLALSVALWTLSLLTPAAMVTWFDVSAPRAAFQPTAGPGDLLVSGLYIFGLLAATMAFSHSPIRLLSTALVYFIGIYLLSAQAGSRPAFLGSIFGAVLAFAVAYHIRQKPAQSIAMLGFWALAIAFMVSESLPGERPIYRSFNWIPFRGHLARPLVGIESLAHITWPVIAAACALRRALPALGRYAGTIAGGTFLAIAGFVLEYAQTQLPGRFGDVTVPLLMVFAWLACWGIQFSQSSLPHRRNALESQ